MNNEDRIEYLPARDWRDNADVEGLTELFKTSAGTQTLRPIQAAALQEAIDCKGLFLHGRVGCGKTLISGLLATALGAKRPLVLVPGADVRKAERDYAELRLHWKIPRTIRIKSYSFISRSENDGWLERNPSDCIIADEGHRLKDIEKGSCARKVMRYLQKNPKVMFCVMSGTLSPHGDLNDYAHLMIAALRKRAPIPLDPRGIKQWARAIEGSGDSRKLLGARSPSDAQERFKKRVASAKGCIISDDTFNDVPLHFSITQHDACESTRQAYQDLKSMWTCPDGWTLEEEAGQFGVAAISRQLGNGFYYRHEPRPPEWFLARRRAWTKLCRTQIEQGSFDSPGAIKNAIRDGRLRKGEQILASWEEAEQSFPMKHVAEWFNGDALQYSIDWARKNRNGLIWVQHIEFGEALEKIGGIKFYRGQAGRDVQREDHKGQTVCVSIQANYTSKNLQHQFHRNLIVDPPANGIYTEQLLGRTHREGQDKPVYAEFYCTCLENYNAVRNSIAAADRIEGTLSPQKMTSFKLPRVHDQDHPAWLRPQKLEDL